MVFYELRLSRFRPQIAKKAMPTKPPNSLEKVGSNCSKEVHELKRKDCNLPKLKVNAEVIDLVESSEEPGPVRKKARLSEYKSNLVTWKNDGKLELHSVVCLDLIVFPLFNTFQSYTVQPYSL